MIGSLTGVINYIDNEIITLDVNGIGFDVYMTSQDLIMLDTHQELTVYTYLQHSEDSMKLFGFMSRSDVEFFKMLINVSGIGPKGALNILSQYTRSELAGLIISKDAVSIAKSPGIGKKTAEKIIIELRDKIKDKYSIDQQVQTQEEVSHKNLNQIIEIGRQFGFTSKEITNALTKLQERGDNIEDMTNEEIMNLIMEVI